jgi:hypothetical protein
VVADEAYGRQIPFAFLERLRDAFLEKFADRGRTAPVDSLNNSFGCVSVFGIAIVSCPTQQMKADGLALGLICCASEATHNSQQSKAVVYMITCLPCSCPRHLSSSLGL